MDVWGNIEILMNVNAEWCSQLSVMATHVKRKTYQICKLNSV